MKILAHTLSAAGHINPMTGLCQALQDRGHRIYFAIDKSFGGQLAKFGFEEILLEPKLPCDDGDDSNARNAPMTGNPIKFLAEQLKVSGFLSNKTALEKLQMIKDDEPSEMLEGILSTCIASEPQMSAAIERIQPDVILLDHFFAVPSIYFSKIPWVFEFSMNPLMLFDSDDVPPFFSGLPASDRTRWREFYELDRKMTESFLKYQNKLLEHFGHAPIRFNKWLTSPHLNIYGYPKELDYTDLAPLPDRFIQVDSFIRTDPQEFSLPEDFKKKMKDDDKLIYISMGSMGSVDVELMQRIISAIASTPYKAIVSKGPLGDEYDLPEGSMWGENYLPQTCILPLVDVVITHGGNNTTAEAFIFGKPMIVIPLYSDQWDNAQRVAEKGFGARLSYGFEPQEMTQTLTNILNDEPMIQRLKMASQRIRDNNCNKTRACEAIEALVK